MTSKTLIIIAAATSWLGSLHAQTAQDKDAIDKLCGCFAVTFNYAETFTNDTINKYFAHPMDTFAVVEYAYPLERSKDRTVIQHLLVIPDGKGTVIKHWREDWVYEQTEQWVYTNTNEWTKVTRPKQDVKGSWTQSVWEVTDAPRYMGSSQWVRTNDQLFWLNSTDAPLPRREFTKRKDYNIMNRTNRIVVSEAGYVHEQDNKKIIRQPGTRDSLLAEEKGYNHYVRLPDAEVLKPKLFWTAEQAEFWKDVTTVWNERMQATDRIRLQTRVNGKLMYEAMDELLGQKLHTEARKEAIAALISAYLVP